MALIQFGTNITDARGSAGGSTYSRNLSGAYVRARVVPVNRKTPKQTQVRANFGANAKAWSGTLTADQRAAWTFFAQQNPLVNKLGASIQISGLAMFTKLNQVLSQIGQPNISDPPADLSVPDLAPALGIVPDSTVPSFDITTAAQAVTANALYYVMASPPLAPGKLPPDTSYRYMGTFAPTAGGVALQMYADFVAAYGSLPAGASVGVTVSFVNSASGALTPAVKFTANAT